MYVRDVLKTQPKDLITVRPTDTLAHASGIMAQRNIGCLVAIDESGDLVGVLTERDIAFGLSEHGPELFNLFVADLMTQKTITIRPDETVEDAIYVFNSGLFRHLVVAVKGKPVGIISIRDILKNIAPLLLEEKGRRDDQALMRFIRALNAA